MREREAHELKMIFLYSVSTLEDYMGLKLWQDEPCFFRGRGGKAAMLMHTGYTYTVGNPIVQIQYKFLYQQAWTKWENGARL